MTAKNHRPRPWNEAEDAALRQMYEIMPSPAVAVALGRSKASIKNRVNKLGIKNGHNSGGFPPGNVPWNKGAHFTAGGRSAETRFRKGQLSGRAMLLKQPVGALRINVDAVKRMDDPEQLSAALRVPGLQKSVEIAIRRRLKLLEVCAA